MSSICIIDTSVFLNLLNVPGKNQDKDTVTASFTEYAELGAEYFTPAPMDMLNDFYLGLSVAALGLIIWLVILLVKDPKGVVKAALFKKK